MTDKAPVFIRWIETAVRFVFDSKIGYGALLVGAIATGVLAVGRPWVLWVAGIVIAAFCIAWAVAAFWRVRRSGRPSGKTYVAPVYTPLSQPDATPGATKRFTRASLREQLPEATGGQGAPIFLPAYGKTFYLVVDSDELPDPPTARTVKTVNEVLAWGEAERATIRALLVASARASGVEATVETIEERVRGGGLSIAEDSGTRSRLATLDLQADWGHEGYVAIAIRNGVPIEASGSRHFELEAYDN